MAGTDWDRFQHAWRLFKSGQAEEACREIDTLIERATDPVDKATLLLCKSTILCEHDRIREARKCVDQARSVAPPNHLVLKLHADFDEACLYIAEHRHEKALRKLDRLLAKNREVLGTPENEDLYQEIQVRRGILLVDLERSREALPILEEVPAFDVEKADAYYHLGVCYFDLGKPELAERRFLDALGIGLVPCFEVRARYYLGVLYFQRDAKARAKSEFQLCERRMQDADIPPQKIFKWLANTCRALRETDEAERYELLAKTC